MNSRRPCTSMTDQSLQATEAHRAFAPTEEESGAGIDEIEALCVLFLKAATLSEQSAYSPGHRNTAQYVPSNSSKARACQGHPANVPVCSEKVLHVRDWDLSKCYTPASTYHTLGFFLTSMPEVQGKQTCTSPWLGYVGYSRYFRVIRVF